MRVLIPVLAALVGVAVLTAVFVRTYVNRRSVVSTVSVPPEVAHQLRLTRDAMRVLDRIYNDDMVYPVLPERHKKDIGDLINNYYEEG